MNVASCAGPVFQNISISKLLSFTYIYTEMYFRVTCACIIYLKTGKQNTIQIYVYKVGFTV